MPAAFEFSNSFAQILAADNRCRLAEINVNVVASVQMGILKIADAPARFHFRPARVPLQRLDFRECRTKAEIGRSHPGKWAEAVEHRVHLAQREMAFVAASQVGVIHLYPGVINGKVQRNLPVGPNQLAVLHGQMVNGKRKEMLDGILLRSPQQHPGGRYIGCTVRSHRDVNYRVFETQRVEAELRAQKGNDLDPGIQVVGVQQRHVGGTFGPMHGHVAHFDLHVEGNNVETADLCAPARYPLQFADQTPARIRLKRFCIDVPPQPGEHRDQAGASNNQHILPPASRSGSRFGHRVCTPSPAYSAAPGTLTWPSERSVCSQETISSFTFSWVSSSRILAETSARGTSPAPDCFNCGTNFSR